MMNEEVELKIRKIKRMLHLSMNRVVADSMKEKGVGYKLIYGTPYLQIKRIASCFEPDEALARELMKYDIREMKILAFMLFPPSLLSVEEMNCWMSDFFNLELVEQASLHLFSKVSFAKEQAFLWLREGRSKYTLIGGLLILRRLFLVSKDWLVEFTEEERVFLFARLTELLDAEDKLVVKTAFQFLVTLSDYEIKEADDILEAKF